MTGRPRKAASKITQSFEQWLGNDNAQSEEQRAA